MNCPFPRYYLCHVCIALAIAAAVWPVLGLYAGLSAGVAFYAGREITQWQGGLPFDWRGFLAPTLACAVVLAVAVML